LSDWHPASRANNAAVTNTNANLLDRLPKTMPLRSPVICMLPSPPGPEGVVDLTKAPFATTGRKRISFRLTATTRYRREQRQSIFLGLGGSDSHLCYQRPLPAGCLPSTFWTSPQTAVEARWLPIPKPSLHGGCSRKPCRLTMPRPCQIGRSFLGHGGDPREDQEHLDWSAACRSVILADNRPGSVGVATAGFTARRIHFGRSARRGQLDDLLNRHTRPTTTSIGRSARTLRIRTSHDFA
jgi:hypothetical protein